MYTRQVPSLYVRVYRGRMEREQTTARSLTIREGISHSWGIHLNEPRFPHYTWGYIRVILAAGSVFQVPSLYVRVYRLWKMALLKLVSSLTIREGISRLNNYRRRELKFPHYTWGYIEHCRAHLDAVNVPSLYVRVYHDQKEKNREKESSLTIREGISLIRVYSNTGSPFPHYTWGYIVFPGFFAGRKAVPSLYMRVYWSFSLLSESLILKM